MVKHSEESKELPKGRIKSSAFGPSVRNSVVL